MKDFHKLEVWQQAHQLTLAVYQLTSDFPQRELYGLTSQLRRCSSSIPANMAEGCGRNGDKELARFCSIAMGSASELEYHRLLAHDLELISAQDYETFHAKVSQVKRMLAGFLLKLKADS